MPVMQQLGLDPKQQIWRYMDLAKFVCLLTDRALYFTNLNSLAASDPYEGFVPRAQAEVDRNERTAATIAQMNINEEEAKAALGQSPLSNLSREWLTKIVTETDALKTEYLELHSMKHQRRIFAASCWHANDGESEAMWKLYTTMGSGVAIESTIDDLLQALRETDVKEEIVIAPVKYANFEQQTPDTYFTPVLTKRRSYQHEQEIRVFTMLSEPDTDLSVPVDLNKMIRRIHISPTADSVFEKAIRHVCSALKFDPPFKIQKSILLATPDY